MPTQQSAFQKPAGFAAIRVLFACLVDKLQQLIGDYPNNTDFINAVAAKVAEQLAEDTDFINAVAAAIQESSNA